MLKDMYDLLTDPLTSPYSTITDKVISIVMIGLILLCIAFVIYLIFHLIDTVGVKGERKTITKIRRKKINPAYTTIISITTNGVTTMIPQHHPETYCIDYMLEGFLRSSSVRKDFFDSLSLGDGLRVTYGMGRITKNFVPVNFSKL